MFKKIMTAGVSFLVALSSFHVSAQEKIDLQEPKQPELLQELKDAPDGVVRYKFNEDGSFKSLVVKATVEIEDVLGAQKGKRLARQEAEMECKKDVTQFLDEKCVFVKGSNKTFTIQTKGESARDAAGNIVKLRNQQGQESKSGTEADASFSQAALQGLTVISSEISPDGPDGQELTLVMALTQKSLSQATAVAKALSGSTPGPVTNGAETDRAKPEIKVNRDVLDDVR